MVIAITDDKHEAVLDAVRNETPDLREVVCVGAKLPSSHDFQTILTTAQPLPAAPSGASDVALLLYSAGSGPGELRAVPHTQRTIEAAKESFVFRAVTNTPSVSLTDASGGTGGFDCSTDFSIRLTKQYEQLPAGWP